MSLAVQLPAGYPAERRWVVAATFEDLLGGVPVRVEAEGAAPGDGVEIRLAEAGDGRRLSLPDGLFALPEDEWLAPASLPELPLPAWRVPETLATTATLVSPEVPVLFGNPAEDGGYWNESTEGGHLALDVFGGIFFCLSRYEEAIPGPRDAHDRFPGSASLAARGGFLDRPLANEYAEILWAALVRLWPGLSRPSRSFRLRLSHDVDQPLALAPGGLGRALRRAAGDLLAGRGPVAALRTVRAAPRVRRGEWAADPANTFAEILALSEAHDLQSVFFFIAGHTGPGEIDGTYRLEDPFLGELFAEIHQRGHEIGLHPSYGTYRDPAALSSELESLRRACDRAGAEQPVEGVRMHYLRWAHPQTWRHQAQAGLAYDTTLGYADLPGFRCGTCHEYRTFDLEERRELPLRERPLIVMEVTLFQYCRLGPEQALEEILRLAAVCRRFRGDFTLLWHNNHLIGAAERETYRRAVEAITGGP